MKGPEKTTEARARPTPSSGSDWVELPGVQNGTIGSGRVRGDKRGLGRVAVGFEERALGGGTHRDVRTYIILPLRDNGSFSFQIVLTLYHP